MELAELLQAAVKHHASDVHLVPGRQPFFRIDGTMRGLNMDPFPPEEVERMLFSALGEERVGRFKADGELDTSYEVPETGRFRVNLLTQDGGVASVIRVIPKEIPTPEAIGLEESMIELADLPRGLVLVAGPAGSGKTTTMASLVDVVNRNRKGHILTIEDPIEYVYPQRGCVVTQREIGSHTESCAAALQHAARQDPDVIMVGRLRDADAISAALSLADTGHLVFAGMCTPDAPQTIARVADAFPPHQQPQVRTQLAGILKAILCQQLVVKADGNGRIAAREMLVVNAPMANLVREGKIQQIYSAIQVGGKSGMRTLDADLARLVRERVITRETALEVATDADTLERQLDS